MWPYRIRPHIGENHDMEPFAEWFARVRQHIPNIPENVAEHWIHEHWGGSPYEFLPLQDLRFVRQCWPLSRLRDVQFGIAWRENPIDYTSQSMPDNPLAQLMSESGTWPEPIIVLDNANDIKRGTTRMGRWHLLEGHRRLDLLRRLEVKGLAAQEHEVWVVSCNGDAADKDRLVEVERGSVSVRYIRGKLRDAIESLVASSGSLQSRLRSAYSSVVHLTEGNFPSDKRDAWNELWDAVKRVSDPERGSVVASIEAMGAREASHLARAFFELYEWASESARQ